MLKKITVALVGNPNCGKTTIFNMLTGARQHVGNYPGVTVEVIDGKCRYDDHEITFVDLPGTYSLTAHSIEELVARNYIIDEQPDVIVDVLDASNIERNLYLTTQLMELEVPLVLAFNMADVAEQQGFIFDNKYLSRLLEANIVPTIGNKGKGRKELLKTIVETAEQGKKERIHKISYGDEIEEELTKLEEIINLKEQALVQKYIPRWLAIKILEQDSDILNKISDKEVLGTAQASVKHLKDIFADDVEIIIADHRYGFISGACQETIRTTVESRHSKSDLIDAVVTNRILGLPIFLILMYVAFFLTFKIGNYPMTWIETLFEWAGAVVGGLWPQGSDSLIRSLLVDGIIGGVGGVIVFLPNILLLFGAISLLEDTGYMARAAFIMDRIMHKIGLHGKSFIPMLIGFGCSVPAIMATRIIENRRNRLTTIMVVPLMSCGARLTIYGLFIPAFFPEKWRGLVLWFMYLIGIVLAVIAAKVLRLTLFRGKTEPFVMELPPYRMPTLKAIAVHTWHRGWLYLKKAGTIILGISIILWFAMNFPRPNPESLKGMSPETAQQKRLEYSVVGRIGLAIEPAIKPLGFDWKIGTALVGATAAKEVFVSQLGIVYTVGSSDEGSKHTLREKLQENYTPLTGFCVILFCLIYAPCVATVAITRQETNSWRWPLLQFFGLTVLAYLLTLIVYQTGTVLLG
ncbi:MAG: ferrous iron transport protein B [Planctomycetota bacterium]|jgi:ferrous iron transport protein B